jgi:FtsP/CotA-like multicopper oxidase with cupredoxin domain
MITRRDFLKLGALTGTGLMLPMAFGSRHAFGSPPYAPPVSPVLTKYLEPLPVPGQVVPTLNPATGFHELALTMANASHSFHAGLGQAQTFGYGGAPYLGPTIIARRGEPIKLTATNALGPHPLTAMVTPDPLNVHGVQAEDAAAPRAAVHLHGAYNRLDSDGGPMEFFPRHPTDAALQGNTYTYTYANDQQAANLWYHDHAFALTRANVYAGLAGYYLLRDAFDTGEPGNPVGLPAGYGTYEIPLVIQDKSFNADGTLFYAPDSGWIPEFFGDVAVVNGKAWPTLDVQQAVYRFRVVNGSQARFYGLSLSSGQVIYQIGTDSGLLDAPVALTSLLIAPGERADILVDFSGSAIGDTIVLHNSGPAPFPGGKRTRRAGGAPLPEIMQFTVAAAAGAGAVTAIPASLRGGAGQPPLITRLGAHAASIVKRRTLVLFEVMGEDEPIAATINVVEFPDSLNGPNAISADGGGAVETDTLEQWNIINLTGDTHPMHIHLVNFQVASRQRINTRQYERAMIAAGGTRVFTAMGVSETVPNTTTTGAALPDPAPFVRGPAFPPAANERGWKDTVHVPPGQVTRLLVPFGSQALGTGVPGIPFGQLVTAAAVAPYDNPAEFNGSFTGTFVWHCHILDHEENDMMNLYQVV